MNEHYFMRVLINSLSFASFRTADGQFLVQFSNLAVERHSYHDHNDNQDSSQSHKEVKFSPFLLIHARHHHRTHYQLYLAVACNGWKQTRIIDNEEESAIERTHPIGRSDIVSDIDITAIEKCGSRGEQISRSRLDHSVA